jgi:hypothetical protein
MLSLFSIRQFIEFLPLIKYLLVHNNLIISYTLVTYLPTSLETINILEILDNKPFLLTMHLVAGLAGVALLNQYALNNAMIITIVGSLNFGVMFLASHYLNEQKQELKQQDKYKNGFEVSKYCVGVMLAFTMPSIATCILTQFGVPGAECSLNYFGLEFFIAGTECYSFYKTTQKSRHLTTADVVIPYIADCVAIAFASHHMSFDVISFATIMLSIKQDLALMASVVAVDYLSRLAVDLVPENIKDSYIDPLLIYAYNIVKDSRKFSMVQIKMVMGYFYRNLA